MMRKMSLFLAVSALSLGAASVANAQSVRVENAVVRMIYMPENRSDIAVEITNDNGTLPRLEVTRSGRDVRIKGGVGGRRGPRISQCRAGRGSDAPSQPGQNASVHVAGIGNIALEDAPMVVIRGPLNAEIATGSAVFGTVTPGARNVEISSGGCGDWVVANVQNSAEINIGGSGRTWVGRSEKLEVAIGGSGDVYANQTDNLEVAIGGSGNVVLQRVNGPVDVAIAGSGDVRIASGDSPEMEVAIAGSGDVTHGGTVGNLSSTIVGSGDIRVAHVTGNSTRTVMGSGRIRIGN